MFRTTGFNSIRTLSARLQYFHAVSGGQLSTLPLELRLRRRSTSQSHRAPIYYVDLTVRSGTTLSEAIVSAKPSSLKPVMRSNQSIRSISIQVVPPLATLDDALTEVWNTQRNQFVSFDKGHHGRRSPGLEHIEIDSDIPSPRVAKYAVPLFTGTESHANRASSDWKGGDDQRMTQTGSGSHGVMVLCVHQVDGVRLSDMSWIRS